MRLLTTEVLETLVGFPYNVLLILEEDTPLYANEMGSLGEHIEESLDLVGFPHPQKSSFEKVGVRLRPGIVKKKGILALQLV